MERRELGPLEVSIIGLGCNNFGRHTGDEDAEQVVSAALDEGVTFFDTADVYGDGESERMLGRALEGRREGVVVATKFGNRMDDDPDRSGARSGWVRRAAENSLRRLVMDTIDLYQLHRPDALAGFAAARGRMILELALSWLASQPVVASIIPGATRPEQVRANVAAAAWALGHDELAEIDRITSPLTTAR